MSIIKRVHQYTNDVAAVFGMSEFLRYNRGRQRADRKYVANHIRYLRLFRVRLSDKST